MYLSIQIEISANFIMMLLVLLIKNFNTGPGMRRADPVKCLALPLLILIKDEHDPGRRKLELVFCNWHARFSN